MRRGRVQILLIGLLALLGLPGCCGSVICDRCEPAGLYLSVTDAWTGMVLTKVTVSVQGKPCKPVSVAGSSMFLCQVSVGMHVIDVQAKDYNPQQAQVTLRPESAESCCPCGPIGYSSTELVPMEQSM